MESSDLQFNNRIPELVRVQLADLREEIRQLNERILKLENARQPVTKMGHDRFSSKR